MKTINTFMERSKATILYNISYSEDEEYHDLHKDAAMEQLKELMALISQKERLELYRFLYTAFNCRM